MMNDEWWMMNDEWWMMHDEWWMMNDEWRMMNDEWWTTNDWISHVDRESYIAVHQQRKDRTHPVLAGVPFRAWLLPFHTHTHLHTHRHTPKRSMSTENPALLYIDKGKERTNRHDERRMMNDEWSLMNPQWWTPKHIIHFESIRKLDGVPLRLTAVCMFLGVRSVWTWCSALSNENIIFFTNSKFIY